MGRKRASPQLATKRGERLMSDKWPDDWEEREVHPQAREDREETERWAEEKEPPPPLQIREDWLETKRWAEEKKRGKEDQESTVDEQNFEDEMETNGWEEGKKEREL
jgi:hypothetical protein